MSRKTLLLPIVSLVLLAVGASADPGDRPPAQLRYAGDHWTAWELPAPAEGSQIYTVVPGDTLWSLANKFLGNPYLWPQIWEQNQYVRDAHWIYPGDPLIVGTKVAESTSTLEDVDLGAGSGGGDTGASSAEGSGAKSTSAGEGGGERLANILDADAAAGAPRPFGSETDLYCSGFVGELSQSFPYTIVGSEADGLNPTMNTRLGSVAGNFGGELPERFGLATGDIVYLNAGAGSGLEPGTVLIAVEEDEPVVHPITRETYGRLYRYAGRVRVLTVQDEMSIAEIVQSCESISVGTHLKLFEPQPVPLGRKTAPRPPNLPSSREHLENAPVILVAKDRQVALGQDNVVFIDRGSVDNVAPGDVFTIYRINKPGLPPVILGELAILWAEQHSALARIIESRFTILVGDRIELK